MKEDLILYYTDEELNNEFLWYLDHTKGSNNLVCTHNKIIRFFQQEELYRVERYLWTKPEVRNQLISNRIKYLGKKEDELTVDDLINGFRRSGIYYGYSGFNPQICKYFYNIISYRIPKIICYDPFGGWGQRMLGSTDIYKYIYNDLNVNVVKHIQDMKEYFGIYNTEIHNEDANVFIPEEEFNVMFTCPPYYNVEVYDNKPFSSREEYDTLLDNIFNIYKSKGSCRVLGLVIREDFLGKHTDYTERYELRNHVSHFNNCRKHKEYLYIWYK